MADSRKRTIQYGSEYWYCDTEGQIGRPGRVNPSPSWRIIGAETLNNFGLTTRRYSLEDVLERPEIIPWKHANGKQKTHILDLDHGTRRMWGSPDHCVY